MTAAFWWEPLEMCRKLTLSKRCCPNDALRKRLPFSSCKGLTFHLLICDLLLAAGWVILIEEKSELARVLVALLVSITCIVLHFAIKPYRR